MSPRLGQRARRVLCRRFDQREAASITVFVVFMALTLVLVAGLVFDAGGALTDRQRAADIAEQAARYGADQLLPSAAGAPPLIDAGTAQTAALTFLRQERVSGTVRASTRSVTVTVTIEHHTVLLQAAGITTLTITGSATATPVPGLQTAVAGAGG